MAEWSEQIWIGGRTLADIEREVIHRAMRLHGARREKVAAELGIGVRTLYGKIARYRAAPLPGEQWPPGRPTLGAESNPS